MANGIGPIRASHCAWVGLGAWEIGGVRSRGHGDIALRTCRIKILLPIRARLRYGGAEVRVEGGCGCHVGAVGGDGAEVRAAGQVGADDGIGATAALGVGGQWGEVGEVGGSEARILHRVAPVHVIGTPSSSSRA